MRTYIETNKVGFIWCTKLYDIIKIQLFLIYFVKKNGTHILKIKKIEFNKFK